MQIYTKATCNWSGIEPARSSIYECRSSIQNIVLNENTILSINILIELKEEI